MQYNMMENTLPSYDEISKVLSYSPDTGIFTRIKRTANCTKVGDTAGHINAQGYVIIKYLSKAYKAHRLAWLFHTKQWPNNDIDHIDGCKSNNKISNLRDVTRSVNSLNTSLLSKNTSGYKGVSLHRGKWRARLMVKGKSTIIGLFDTPEKASEAYINYKNNL